MKGLKDILLLGDPRLYEQCSPINKCELPLVLGWVSDLRNAMNEIRERYNFGRGIAAPQLGIMKRLVYIDVDEPLIIINPEYVLKSERTFQLWDDCMSFPNLLVKVQRHKAINIKYKDEHWKDRELNVQDDMSELIQHEIDHLDGILCIDKAIDQRSFRWRP